MLLPVDMREWLPPDHLVWFVLETVESLGYLGVGADAALRWSGRGGL